MRCEEARQYFDAYLDGELSPALATELGAHRLRCPDCRRRLALLEVSGHIIAADREPVELDDGFTHRLLACVEAPSAAGTAPLRRWLYIGAPLAAAAVVALAFLGAFDRRTPNRVLGVKAVNEAALDPLDEAEDDLAGGVGELASADATPPEEIDPTAQAMQQWIESGKSLGQMFNMTILQTLDILEEAKNAAGPESHYPGAAPAAQPHLKKPTAPPPSQP